MALNGFGRLIDIKFRTLSCKSRVIIDEECRLTVNDIITKDLLIKKNATVNGDLEVLGNIITQTGNVTGNNTSSSSFKYQYSAEFVNSNSLDTTSSASLDWTDNLQNSSGHMFTGPTGTPLDITILAGQDASGPFVCNLVIEELNESELNSVGPIVGNVTSIPFTGTGNVNLFLSGTVTATKSPAFWHYYCVSGGTPSTTFMRGIYIKEV